MYTKRTLENLSGLNRKFRIKAEAFLAAAAVIATLETGAVSDLATEWDIGEGCDWGVINSGPSLLTVTSPGASHTLTGLGTVATTTAGTFRTVKTAADTFVTTRIG